MLGGQLQQWAGGQGHRLTSGGIRQFLRPGPRRCPDRLGRGSEALPRVWKLQCGNLPGRSPFQILPLYRRLTESPPHPCWQAEGAGCSQGVM